MRIKTSQQVRIAPRGLPANVVEQFPSPQHARWGQRSNTPIQTSNLRQIANPALPSIATLTHPLYDSQLADWAKWRLVYEGGDTFVDEYLRQFSKRETADEFRARKEISPIPAFAKAAITEIKNAIFQRMADTVRAGGPDSYSKSITGQLRGVDLKGATMNWFIGHYVISELLSMKKVGVWTDAPDFGLTLKDKGNKHPYYYAYKAENIRNWKYADSGDNKEFESVLLRDYEYVVDDSTGLPTGEIERFRYAWISKTDGFVHVQYFTGDGQLHGVEITLPIRRIPFVVFEIDESLLKDVANAQIALLNLESSDISYALKGNFPFYTEQYDTSANTELLKRAQDTYNEHQGTDVKTPRPNQSDNSIEVGATQGRRYPKGMDRPDFINPSPEPLEVSMKKQEALKEDIRQLVHLALSSIQPKMASAESKVLDQQGLESGLSYIGLELEHGERQLADYWAMYEGSEIAATVNYPKQWSLKSADQVQKEVDQLKKMREDIPSLTFKKQINIKIAGLILGTSIDAATLAVIEDELRKSQVPTSDPDVLLGDLEAGVVDEQTASTARGYLPTVLEQARKDHAARLARIQESQTAGLPAARGNPDSDPNKAGGAIEKIGQPARGNAQ